MTEVSLLERWSKETGNAPNAKWRLQNFLLNQLQTDQFIAENAGQKRDLQDSAANSLALKTKNRLTAVFCLDLAR